MLFTAIKKSSVALFFGSLLISWTPLVTLAQVPTEKSLMWEISGNGITQPSYLFGTIHRACTNQLVLKPKQRQVLERVQQLYLEVDISDSSVAISALVGSQIPGGRSLQDIASARDYHKIKKFFEKELALPFWTISRTRPLLLLGSVIGGVDECKTNSWEAVLGKLAKKKGWKINGLETAQDQLSVFDRVPIKDQVKILVAAIDNHKILKKQGQKAYRDLQIAYKNQDIAKLYNLVVQESVPSASLGAQKDFTVALLDERNQKWIPIIGQVAKEKPTFFGVGAGHLGGEQGVISLLRNAGYTVKPVFER